MPQETIKVLDVVLRESPSWNYVTVSRSLISTTFGHRGDFGEGLECWRDVSATPFFKPVTVIKFVEEFLSIRDTSRPLSGRDRVKIKKALCGVRIETSHQLDQIRRYKITGITPIPMSQLIFPVDDKGTRMTVVQYFWDKYNYRLKYASWPCLQAFSDSRPVYLPMEVCKIVEGQRYSKKLNDRQVANMLRATCKCPQEREKSICDMVLHNKYAEDRFAQEFGINVSSDLVAVPASVLPPPLLRYHDFGREKTCAPSFVQGNMINKDMISGGTIRKWPCSSSSCLHPEEVQRFCMDLIHMCNTIRMVMIVGTTLSNGENIVKDGSAQKSVIISVSGSSESKKVTVEVQILDFSIQVNILQSSTVADAVYAAMNQLKIWISDFYVTNPCRVLLMESIIGNFYKLVVAPRLRGGKGEPSASKMYKIPLNVWIAQIQQNGNCQWFEKITVPYALLRSGLEDWLVVLGSGALLVLCLVLDLLERAHALNLCYEGLFDLKDINFIPLYGILVMDERIRDKKLHHDGYKADLLTVVEKLLVRNFVFRKRDGTWHYPAYVGGLVTLIRELKKKDAWCFSVKRRSLIFNNPATWSSAKRVNIFTLVNQYIKRLPQVDRRALYRVMPGSSKDWHPKVTDINGAQAMKEVFYHEFWNGSNWQAKFYPTHLIGRADFTRCVIIHAMDSQVAIIVVDAALYMIWPELLERLHLLLTVDFNPPSKKRISNKGKGPAVSTSSAEFHDGTLPAKQDLEVHEIFGLRMEPKD